MAKPEENTDTTNTDILAQFHNGVLVKYDQGYDRIEIIYDLKNNYYVTGKTIEEAFYNFKEWYILGNIPTRG